MDDETKTKTKDMRTEVSISLDFPVTVEAVSYSVLIMRRPKTKDSIKIAKMKNATDQERAAVLFADLCNVSPNVIGELDDTDTEKLGDQLNAFRGGQAT